MYINKKIDYCHYEINIFLNNELIYKFIDLYIKLQNNELLCIQD